MKENKIESCQKCLLVKTAKKLHELFNQKRPHEVR